MKKFATIVIPLVVLLVSIAALALGAAAASADNGKFATEDLEGAFAFAAAGTLYPAFPETTPAWSAAAVGLFTFDGAGGCTIVDKLNIGAIGPAPANGYRTSTTCTYTVNADGTGTLETSFGGPPGDINGPGTLTFAIVSKGPVMELRFIRSDPGAVASGVARQQ